MVYYCTLKFNVIIVALSLCLAAHCIMSSKGPFLLPEAETKHGSVYKRLWQPVARDSSVFWATFLWLQSAESSRRGRAPGQPVPGNGSCQTRGIPAKNTRSPPRELQKHIHEPSWRCQISRLRSGKPLWVRIIHAQTAMRKNMSWKTAGICTMLQKTCWLTVSYFIYGENHIYVV